MKRISVKSSNIVSIGYENETLEIEFDTGNIYQYLKVPLSIYDGLMAASSVGNFFWRRVRGNFDYKKIN